MHCSKSGRFVRSAARIAMQGSRYRRIFKTIDCRASSRIAPPRWRGRPRNLRSTPRVGSRRMSCFMTRSPDTPYAIDVPPRRKRRQRDLLVCDPDWKGDGGICVALTDEPGAETWSLRFRRIHVSSQWKPMVERADRGNLSVSLPYNRIQCPTSQQFRTSSAGRVFVAQRGRDEDVSRAKTLCRHAHWRRQDLCINLPTSVQGGLRLWYRRDFLHLRRGKQHTSSSAEVCSRGNGCARSRLIARWKEDIGRTVLMQNQSFGTR